jgi:cell division protein FtsN
VLETNTPAATEDTGDDTNTVISNSASVLTVTNFVTNFITMTNTAQEQNSYSQPSHFKYSVQAGSFRSLKNAKKLYNHLREKGYNAYYTRIMAGKTRYYRVRAGKFNSIAGADSLMNKLRDEGYRPVLIKIMN